VHFKLREQAEEAKLALNGSTMRDHVIYVDWFHNSSSRASQQAARSRIQRGGGLSGFSGYSSQSGLSLNTPVVSLYVRFESIEVM